MVLQVNRIALSACQGWRMDAFGLHHTSQRYFSVAFVHDGRREYIMIDQPEVGILGILIAGEGREYRWLLQHKAEPGNVGVTQWAPTVQATRSNYERVHGGKATPMLEFFLDSSTLHSDVLGSEQGDRFLNKFNRNSKRVLLTPWSLGVNENHCAWHTNRELKQILRQDYSVNTDARSVISSGMWSLLAEGPETLFLRGGLTEEIAIAFHRSSLTSSLERMATARQVLIAVHRDYPIEYRKLPLVEVQEYRFADDGIYDTQGRRVMGYFDCLLSEREVPRWQQPLIERDEVSDYVLLFTIKDGIALFNVAAYPEIGHHGRVEFGASLQSGDGLFKYPSLELSELMTQAEVLLQIHQSDEGGRFYQNIGRYVIAQWHGDPTILQGLNRHWLSLADLERFSLEQGLLSNELRTLLSLVLSSA